jgi:putative transposon-encoded protein
MVKTEREEKDSYTIQGYEIRSKIVAKSGKAGRIYLPQEWIGKKVKVIRVN